jgi:hypothetical protein
MSARKIHGAWLKQFKSLLVTPHVTLAYLKTGDAFGFFSERGLDAGYCLVHAPLDTMPSILQIPFGERGRYGNEDPFKYAEILGFVQKSRTGFWLHLASRMLVHRASCFVYSYPASDLRLADLASPGRPLRLYEGSGIRVEVMTRAGLARLLLTHAYRKIAGC